jgi:hypothetical protein
VHTVRAARGLRLPAAAAADPLTRLGALRQLLPAAAVFSHRTAADLRGLWLPAGPGARVEITVPTPRPATTTVPQRPEVHAHRRGLLPVDVGEIAGLPVTGAGRTWCDLAEVLALPDLIAAGDSALRGGATPAELAGALGRRRCPRGRRSARVALPLLCGRSRSRQESLLRVALLACGLPAPAVNEAVHDGQGQWVAEPDLSYAEARLAIEYQGAHHADPQRLRRDLTRGLDLHRAGWLVLSYGAPDLRRPETVAADVREALARRAPQLLTAPTRVTTSLAVDGVRS